MVEVVTERKLKWEFFEPQLGDWAPRIKPFFDEGGFDPIYSRLKQRSKAGKVIAPNSRDTFRAFRETPYSSLKCVVMGMCPYHSMVQGVMVADGLAMSCGNHLFYKAPSLEQFYDALEQEFEEGLCLPCNRPQSLSYLAEQGVLLTNAHLTTEIGIAGIHGSLWAPFTQYMLEEVYSTTMVPLLFLGKVAQEYERYKAPMQWSFDVSHPASAAYKNKKWDSEKVFTKLNEVMYNQSKQSVCWLEDSPPF